MKNNTKKTFLMIALIVIFCVIMAVVDVNANYFVKSIIKVVMFLVLPAAYSFFDKNIKVKELFIPNKKGIKTAFALGFVVYIVIMGGYFLCKNIFDFSEITGTLTKNIGVKGNNFIFVSLYISFINSLMEEFFFRGFVFFNLKRLAGRKFAYLFSSAVFAVYHVAMMVGWFKFDVFVIVMLGLFAGGLIFNYLNEKSETVYPSWIVHMFSNFAINTIGFILFGIIG